MHEAAAAIDKHRLAGLQDGVYSIAMTLLVLELKLPALPEHVTDAVLWSALLSIWPKLLTWLLSFWVLAIFWMGDARVLGALGAVNRFQLRVSLWRLALVSLLPFTTAFMGEHGRHTVGAATYAAHLVLLAATQVIRHHELRRQAPAYAESELHAGLTLACALVAFALAFIVPAYNMFALLPMLVLQRVGRRGAPQGGPA